MVINSSSDMSVAATCSAVLQAEASDLPLVNGHSDADVTDANVARGGDEAAQSRSRQSAHTSATSASVTGSLHNTLAL